MLRLTFIVVIHVALVGSCFAGDPSEEEFDLTISPQAAPGSFRAAQELNLDFATTPVGKRKKWLLDSGAINDGDPNEKLREKGPLDNYSGIRLRRPLGKQK